MTTDLDLKTLVERFRDGESYILTQDVANPGRDKRKVHGHGLDAQGDVIAQGSRWLCQRHKWRNSDDVSVSLKQATHGDAEILVSLYAGNAMGIDGLVVASLHDGDNKNFRATMLGVLRALVLEDRSIGTLEAVWGRYHRMPWRILEALVKSGKITVAEADNAARDIEEKDAEEGT